MAVFLLRKPETQEKYDMHKAVGALERGCVLCNEFALQTFQFWRIVKNDFPYDVIANIHHMLIPIRHVVESELTDEERKEFNEIKNSYLAMHYDGIYENMPKGKTIPTHMHLHLFVFKISL